MGYAGPVAIDTIIVLYAILYFLSAPRPPAALDARPALTAAAHAQTASG